MPIRKFRSIEEMSDADLTWLPQGSPESWRAIRRVWARAQAMAPWRVPPGVYRYKTMEEANAQRALWERTCVEVAARRIVDGEPGTRGR